MKSDNVFRQWQITDLHEYRRDKQLLHKTIIEYLREGNIDDELALTIADALEKPPGRGAKPRAYVKHFHLASDVVDALEEGYPEMAAYSLAAERYSATDEPVTPKQAEKAYAKWGEAIKNHRELDHEMWKEANKNKDSPD